MIFKECRICHEIKKLDMFPKRKTAADGHRTECKSCNYTLIKNMPSKSSQQRKIHNRRYYLKYPEKMKENSKEKWQHIKTINHEQTKQYKRDWYAKNKERAREYARGFKDKNLNWFKEYEERNKDIISIRKKKWVSENKSLVREKTRRYQASKRGATPKWISAIQRAQIQEFYDIAFALETQTGMAHHVDHIHPLNGENLCGLHVPWNLQILPWRDNISKGNRIVEVT